MKKSCYRINNFIKTKKTIKLIKKINKLFERYYF